MLEDKRIKLPKSIKDISNLNPNKQYKIDYYNIIKVNEQLEKYLVPAEELNNFLNLINFINEHKVVILKSRLLNCRKVICLIEKKENYYKFIDYGKKQVEEVFLKDEEELKLFLNNENVFLKQCIVQKNVKPTQIGETVYDLKYIMKKHGSEEWNIDFMECRVGGNNFIINYKREKKLAGIITEELKKAFPKGYSFKRFLNEIFELCICVCIAVDKAVNNLTSMCIGITMDEDSRLWIVDIGNTSSLNNFKFIDYGIYNSIKHIPFLYESFY